MRITIDTSREAQLMLDKFLAQVLDDEEDESRDIAKLNAESKQSKIRWSETQRTFVETDE